MKHDEEMIKAMALDIAIEYGMPSVADGIYGEHAVDTAKKYCEHMNRWQPIEGSNLTESELVLFSSEINDGVFSDPDLSRYAGFMHGAHRYHHPRYGGYLIATHFRRI